MPRETLQKMLANLYTRFENVRNFMDLQITGIGEPVVSKYKSLIKKRLIEEIEDGSGGLKGALNTVRTFSAMDAPPRDKADVMLWYVESAVDCIGNYGDLWEEFYEEAENMFEEVLRFIKRHSITSEFQSRCKKVVDESADTGYGFHDSLGDLFHNAFPDVKPLKPKPLKPTRKKK